MEVSALASHSSGNSFFVKANGSAFLIDAGITCKQIVARLSKLGYDPDIIKGIFVTHAHSDHTRGIDVFTRKFNTPIYSTQGTYDLFKKHMKKRDNINFIDANKHLSLGDVDILPFSKSHDCADPVSYTINYGGNTASIITDIGYACDNVKHAVQNSDILALETNHDLEMLNNGPYPYYLKARITSNKGHLSNYDAGLLVMEHASPRLKHLLLSHLSKTNNTPELAMQAMQMVKERKDLASCNIVMTSKEDPTDIFS